MVGSAAVAPAPELFTILYPDKRRVTGQRLIDWAKDDIANGQSGVFAAPEEVVTVADAIAVLNDSGTVTVAAR